MRRLVVLLAVAVLLSPPPLPPRSRSAPIPRDATPRRVTQLPELEVTVTRTTEPLTRVPFAVGVLDRDELVSGASRRSASTRRSTTCPGVFVANRYNYSLDQRISIRGFGSRSNFGVRGLKVLLDGIPQTLPDGQSQLTNVDFADLERAEVLRGASSSLYGNASGGVISLPDASAPTAGPSRQRVRVQGGDGKRDERRLLQVAELDLGPLGQRERHALASRSSRPTASGSTAPAEFRQLNAGRRLRLQRLDRRSPSGSSLADNPEAQNPGALTAAEYVANPDSAAANNILRGADKDVQQQQLALGLKHFDAAGNEYEVNVFGLLRDLENPLAAPPPGHRRRPTDGTYVAHRPRRRRRSGAAWRRAARQREHGAAAHRRRRPPAHARRPGEPASRMRGAPTDDGAASTSARR